MMTNTHRKTNSLPSCYPSRLKKIIIFVLCLAALYSLKGDKKYHANLFMSPHYCTSGEVYGSIFVPLNNNKIAICNDFSKKKM